MVIGAEICVCSEADSAGPSTLPGGLVASLQKAFRFKSFDNYNPEFAMLGCSLLLILYSIVGRRKNDAVATKYASLLVSSDSPALKNFEMVDGKLRELAQGTYGMYFSGRRNIKGCMVRLKSIPRHDMVSKVILAHGACDSVTVEVALQSYTAPRTVFVVGNPGSIKIIQEEHEDVRQLASRIDPPNNKLPDWPQELVVMAEHNSVFFELMSTPAMRSFFGKDFHQVRKYFRSLHVTDSYMHGEERQILRFCADMPPADDKQTLFFFLQTVLACVDSISACSMSPDVLKKSLLAREQWDSKKPSVLEQRRRRVEQKKAAKDAADKAKLAAMTPEQREKERARREKIDRGRRMRSMVKKI
eukprot:jgi/Picsp_1/4490/NSC_06711-R1_protein